MLHQLLIFLRFFSLTLTSSHQCLSLRAQCKFNFAECDFSSDLTPDRLFYSGSHWLEEQKKKKRLTVNANQKRVSVSAYKCDSNNGHFADAEQAIKKQVCQVKQVKEE